jgi:NAD(P)-dependent dehydrogenase (short-subunit alcohol dehydrogenase family)
MLPEAPSFRLDGRRALVTGAGRGIGVALATALARAGAHVDLAARSLVEVQAIAAAIRSSGGKAEGVSLDVTDCAAVRRALADAASTVHGDGEPRHERCVLACEEGHHRGNFFGATNPPDRMLLQNFCLRLGGIWL